LKNTLAQYKIGFLKKGDDTGIIIYTDDHRFIARASLIPRADNLFEVSEPIARSGFETLLYQSLARYATSCGAGIMSARDGVVRESDYNQWAKLSEGAPSYMKTGLPGVLSENTGGIYGDALVFSYKLPLSQLFRDTLVDMSVCADKVVLANMWEKSGSYFDSSYDANGSEWLDVDHPLPVQYQKREYPFRTIAHVDSIMADKLISGGALWDLESGDVKNVKKPIRCSIDIDGDLVMSDGHYRYIEALVMDRDHVEILIEKNEYLNGFNPEVVRLDKNDVFGGLNSLRYQFEIDEIKQEHRKRIVRKKDYSSPELC
jgi:hypothetical protein